MQLLLEYQPKRHSPLLFFSACDSLQDLLLSEKASFQQGLQGAGCFMMKNDTCLSLMM
jgi:hypothetical protein